jgi:hypothetical protein
VPDAEAFACEERSFPWPSADGSVFRSAWRSAPAATLDAFLMARGGKILFAPTWRPSNEAALRPAILDYGLQSCASRSMCSSSGASTVTSVEIPTEFRDLPSTGPQRDGCSGAAVRHGLLTTDYSIILEYALLGRDAVRTGPDATARGTSILRGLRPRRIADFDSC